ncbi:hypothetical protein ACOSQ2_008804 [Xanthoceras sorbifolium]
MVGCHAETPLHIASLLGHAEFVQEILSRKPELVGELDARKSSPLLLATAKGYLDIVKMLVSVNLEACSVCDRDRRNPLHIATIKGHVSVLKDNSDTYYLSYSEVDTSDVRVITFFVFFPQLFL